MRRLRRAWARRHEPINLTVWKAVVAGLLVSASTGGAFLVAVEGIVRLADETRERTAADRRSKASIEGIARRVVREQERTRRDRDLLRALNRTCRQIELCREILGEQRRRQRDPAPPSDGSPLPNADRPPRSPATPPPEPDPVAGGEPPRGKRTPPQRPAPTPAPTPAPSAPAPSGPGQAVEKSNGKAPQILDGLDLPDLPDVPKL